MSKNKKKQKKRKKYQEYPHNCSAFLFLFSLLFIYFIKPLSFFSLSFYSVFRFSLLYIYILKTSNNPHIYTCKKKVIVNIKHIDSVKKKRG